MKKILFLFICSLSFCFSKIRIVTFHFNKPNFLELQIKCLNHFLSEDYELIVINDAVEDGIRNKIAAICSQNNVQHIFFKQEWHEKNRINELILDVLERPGIYSHISSFQNTELTLSKIANQPSVRHSHAIQYALEHFGYNHDDIFVILDGDAFPIRRLDIRQMMGNHDIIGMKRSPWGEDIEYLWVPFIAIHFHNLPNREELQFYLDEINGNLQDTGSHSYHYLQKYPQVSVKMYEHQASSRYQSWLSDHVYNCGFNKEQMWLIYRLPSHLSVEFAMDKRILHYAGSSFDPAGKNFKETIVEVFFEKILRKRSLFRRSHK
ncbi:MAG: hypothetical protein MRY21_02355 [Simkaniaceae bacterium]|nr:hypothetical protein [Simkaniaceae bacterium]